MEQNKKTILIPGWMNGGGMYSARKISYDVLEIWRDKINPENKIEAKYIIGHSLGCNWALFNWERNKNTKLILVNPLLSKRKIGEWFSKWREFHKKEKKPESKEIVWSWLNIFFGLKTCWRLLAHDFDETIKKIPKEDIVIIHGEKDVFYCDEKFKEYIRLKNIQLIEVESAGHDWHEKFEKEIEKIMT